MRAGEMPPEMEDWWTDFARSLRRRNRSDATARMYREAFILFWRWAAEVGIEMDPAAVTTADVNAFTDKLVASGLAATTIAITWRNLRPFFSWWAKETGDPDPFAGADVPAVADDKPPPVIPMDNIRALLATCSGPRFEDRRDTAIIRVLFDTGCRLGELVGLRVGDWDRREDLLTLSGKTGTRVVSLSASRGEALARYLRVRGQHRHAAGDALWIGPKGDLKEVLSLATDGVPLGLSVGFSPISDRWSRDRRRVTRLRACLGEVSVVGVPQYPESMVAAVRSSTPRLDAARLRARVATRPSMSKPADQLTTVERRWLAEHGMALSDGSFPIRHVADLDKAISSTAGQARKGPTATGRSRRGSCAVLVRSMPSITCLPTGAASARRLADQADDPAEARLYERLAYMLAPPGGPGYEAWHRGRQWQDPDLAR